MNLLPFTYFVESAWRSDVRQTSTLHMLLLLYYFYIKYIIILVQAILD